MNTVSISGRLASDPRVATFDKGASVTRLRVAVRRPLASGDSSPPDYFDVQAWGALGAAAQRLCVGQPVGISGRLRQHTQTTEAGERRDRVYVVADWIDFPPPATTPADAPAVPASDLLAA